MNTQYNEMNTKATEKLGTEAMVSQGSNGLWYVYKVSAVTPHKDMSGEVHMLKSWKKVSRMGAETPEAAIEAL